MKPVKNFGALSKGDTKLSIILYLKGSYFDPTIKEIIEYSVTNNRGYDLSGEVLPMKPNYVRIPLFLNQGKPEVSLWDIS